MPDTRRFILRVLAENKQASEELKESLENLETVTKRIEENKG
jgi:hypothetical protein